MCQASLIWSAGEFCSSTETQGQQSTASHSKWRDWLDVLIRPVLKGGMKDDAGVVEDKTGVGETETEDEGGYSPDMLAGAIWVSGSSNFFSK